MPLVCIKCLNLKKRNIFIDLCVYGVQEFIKYLESNSIGKDKLW